jgi:hypothetical protein
VHMGGRTNSVDGERVRCTWHDASQRQKQKQDLHLPRHASSSSCKHCYGNLSYMTNANGQSDGAIRAATVAAEFAPCGALGSPIVAVALVANVGSTRLYHQQMAEPLPAKQCHVDSI